MRTPAVRIGTGVLAGILALSIAAPPVSAVTSADSGWWTAAAPLATAGVPEDGLLVQGGVDQPVSYAAVAFELESDEQPVSLRLDLAPDSISAPGTSLTLCPLDEPFTPAHSGAHGEPIDDAPGYDCADGVAATASDDGTSFTFDVSGLDAGEPVTMAVTPTNPVDRAVLQSPDIDNLQTRPGTDDGGALPPPPAMPDTTAPAGPAPFTPDVAPPAAPSTPFLPTPPTTVAALAPEPAPVTPAEQADELGSLDAPPLANAFGPLDEGSLAGRLAFAAVVLGAIGLWTYAGRRRIHAVSEAL